MALQDRKKEIEEINKKLAVIGGKELFIINTTATALYNRQQLDLCEEQQLPRNMPELVAK